MTKASPYQQLWRMFRTQSRLGVSAALATIIAIICIPHAMTKSRGLDKLLTICVGAMATEVARRTAFAYFDWRDTDADLNYVEKRHLIKEHIHELKDEIKPMLLPEDKRIEIEGMIYDPVEYWLKQGKHLLIVGGTGAGKSTFVKNFCKRLSDWSIKVYDIDATVDDWSFADETFVDFQNIEHEMSNDLSEIPSLREERRLAGKGWSTKPKLMIADEFPALVAKGEAPIEKKLASTARRWISTHAKQTRKLSRMICVLVQNDTVRNVGLEGDASLRDTCFVCVYLGQAAYDRAKAIGKPELVDWLRETGFTSCIIDTYPALRP